MGAHDDHVYVQGIEDPQKAYDKAWREAEAESGSSGYSGTIATSNGYRVAHRVPVHRRVAEAMADGRINNLQKWDVYEAIAIATPESFKTRDVTKTIRLDVPAIPYSDELIRQLEQSGQLGLRDGEFIEQLSVTNDDVTWRPEVVAPDGDRTISYIIEVQQAVGWRRRDKRFDERFKTLADARKALTDGAKRWGKPRPRQYPLAGREDELVVPNDESVPLSARIVGVVDRGLNEDGDEIPMLTATTVVKSRKITVEARVARPDGTPKLGGWLFYGWAAS